MRDYSITISQFISSYSTIVFNLVPKIFSLAWGQGRKGPVNEVAIVLDLVRSFLLQ